MTANNYTKYDEDFKKSLVTLYQNGKTQTLLCKEYGVSQSVLAKWVNQYSTVEMDDGDVLTAKQVKELQKHNAQLEEENLILNHLHASFKQRLDAFYKLRFQHSIKTLCRVLKVNRSTYYKHFSSKPSPHMKENQYIASQILHIYADYQKRLGAYKITYVLKHDYGINISIGKVYRLMKQLQLPKMSTDKHSKSHQHSDNKKCCNHLQQNFNQKSPNLVRVSNITYIKASGKSHYLCIIMDLYSRKVISWHISTNTDTELVMTTFRKAYEKRNAPYGLMFHSDRGIQYTFFTFRQFLDSLNVVQSFSKKGYPFDNACCGSFSNISKKETNRKNYHSI